MITSYRRWTLRVLAVPAGTAIGPAVFVVPGVCLMIPAGTPARVTLSR